jgi:hypothetical protein
MQFTSWHLLAIERAAVEITIKLAAKTAYRPPTLLCRALFAE